MIRFLDLIITERCNSRCKICSIWREGKKTKNELSKNDIKTILESNAAKSVECIDLSGGEPFLREDLVDIVKLVRGYLPDVRISISTNGLNTDKILSDLEKIRKNGEIDLRISLDGLEETHNIQRGVDNAFQCLTKTIKLVSKRFPDQTIIFLYVISPWNYKDILATYRFVKSLNPKYGFLVNYAHDVGNYKTYISNKEEMNYKETFKFSKSQILAIKKQLDELFCEYIKEKDFTNALFVNQIPSYLEKSVAPTFFCDVPFKMALVLPSKLAYNCIMMDSIGNLNKNKLDEVVNSNTAKKNEEVCKSGKCEGCMLFIGNYTSYDDTSKLFEYFLNGHQILERKDIIKLNLLDGVDKNLKLVLSKQEDKIYCSLNNDEIRNNKEKLNEILKKTRKLGKEIVITKPIPRCIIGIDINFIKRYAYIPSSCRDCYQLFLKEKGIIKICEHLKEKNLVWFLREGIDSFFDKIKENKACSDCNVFRRMKCDVNPCYDLSSANPSL